ncbi:MAG TPA: ROK family protein [Bryobacteraceae bacterium]|nr:ROK family protein [Bryobacteraceae bacterium]
MISPPLYGAIEAGGTKFVCGVGTGPEDLVTTRIPTTSPVETIAAAAAWLREESRGQLISVGIGSFGPVDLRRGRITSTPKAAWRNCDLAGEVARQLGVPVGFDTDVNAAALGEARWGAARGIANCLYLTVGTGIGGGAIVDGRLARGMAHPEMGHIRVPRDFAADAFAGVCSYHGDCLEGLASGPAIEARWGKGGPDLGPDHPAWQLEARYLALGVATFVCVLSPQRILIGGGVMRQKQLYDLIRADVDRVLARYIEKVPEILPPALAELSGVLGGLVIAEQKGKSR